jgi:hypothetical protein
MTTITAMIMIMATTITTGTSTINEPGLIGPRRQ